MRWGGPAGCGAIFRGRAGPGAADGVGGHDGRPGLFRGGYAAALRARAAGRHAPAGQPVLLSPTLGLLHTARRNKVY